MYLKQYSEQEEQTWGHAALLSTTMTAVSRWDCQQGQGGPSPERRLAEVRIQSLRSNTSASETVPGRGHGCRQRLRQRTSTNMSMHTLFKAALPARRVERTQMPIKKPHFTHQQRTF